MANRKPLVLDQGVVKGLPVGDVLNPAYIGQDSDHQMITLAERAAIGSGGGGSGSLVISDTEPLVLPGTTVLWLQTNVDGDSENIAMKLVTGV